MKRLTILTTCFLLNACCHLYAQNDTVKLKYDQNKRISAMTVISSDDENNIRTLSYVFNYNKAGFPAMRICTEGKYVDTTFYTYDEKGLLLEQKKLLYTSTSGVKELLLSSNKTYTLPDTSNKRNAAITEKLYSKDPVEVEWQVVYQFDKTGNLTSVSRGNLNGDTSEYSWKTIYQFQYSKSKNRTAIPDYNFFFEIDMDFPQIKNELISSLQTNRSKRPKAIAEKWGQPEITLEEFSGQYTYEYDKLGRPTKRITTYAPGKNYSIVYIYE